ncbi:TPR-like protein [Aureobasidium pullulans]|nr:TPR-like protein [Aureobasidium pullulans]
MNYKVGWITALPIEAAAARAMLDEIHPSLQTPYHDSNVYTFGQANTTDKAGAGTHNVVVASGRPGKANAATVANDMRRTFPWLRIGLMVGIAGGVWSPETDVRLGDVVVGIHLTGEAGIIQYDYGKSIQDKAFVKTGAMNKAPGILLNAVAAVQAKHLFYDLPDTGYISNLGREYAKRFARRPIEDRLFHASYVHQTGSCEQCDRKQLRDRPQRDDSLLPRVHYGAIASGDRVVRDAVFAEEIRKTYGVLCFEMEAAGLDGFPSLTIRGVSDYCDTHKNDDWHQYAAISAAAYAKELLSGIGGSGKSEMAIRFAEENKHSFWGIFWINVSSQVIAEQSFADLAQAVGLSNTTVQHVVHWLSNLQRSWLLVLDNYDDKETDISKFIPSSGGSIIITTRLAGLQGNTEVLDAMDYGDAIELLYKACIIEDKEQNTHMYHAKSVVELLGRHALALVHAGAYIRQGYTSLEEYPQLFQQQQKRLMQFKPGHLIPGNDSVYATFEISAQYLASSKEPADQKALGLLNVLAFMEGSNIHEDMLVKALESGQGPDASGTPHRVFEGAPWTTRSVDYPRFSKDDIDLATLELRQIPWAWDNNDPNMIKILRQIDSQEVRALYKDASGPLRTPVFPKIHKRHLEIETLESFHLPWDFDFETGQFIVILREMEKHEIDLLFEHTARHRERGRFEDSISQSADGINEGHSSHDLYGSIEPVVGPLAGNPLVDFGVDSNPKVPRPESWEFPETLSDDRLHRSPDINFKYACSVSLYGHSSVKGINGAVNDPMHKEMAGLVGSRGLVNTKTVTADLRPLDSISEWDRDLPLQSASLVGVVQDTDDHEVDHLSCWHHTQAFPIGVHNLNVISSIRDAKVRLAEMSLVRFSGTTISLHPLIHQWTRIRQNELEQRQAWASALCILALSTEAKVGLLPFTSSLRLHLEACWLNWIDRLSDTAISLEVARGLYFLGRQLYKFGSLASSEIFHTLDVRVKLDHKTTSYKRREFSYCEALCLLSTDRAGEAKILLELVLKERSKSFTAASKEVLVPIVTLAQIYLGDGDHQMVIPMLEPITWPKSNNYDAYDGDHRDSIYTLALAYMKADQYTLAKVLLEEVVTSEKHLSLTTEAARLSRMDTLAQVYVVLGEEYRAEPLFDEINALRAQMWDSDPESPYQLMGMRNLVTTYLFFGLFENAAYILADIVRVTTRTLHLSHPTRLENMAQLAAVSLKTGSNDNAIELLEEVLRLGDSKNPPRHRVVADLAEAYIRIGKSDKALNLLEKTLENDTSATTMTEDHKIGLWRKLATAYGTSGQYLRAVSSLQEILQVDENNGDPARVGFLEADLATAFMNLGDIDKAVDLLEDAISRIVQKHTPAAYLLSSKLALAYMWTGSFAKAIPVLEQLIQAMQVGKKPVDSELMLEECKLSWAYFQTRDVFKATYLLDEGMQTQVLVYPFKYESLSGAAKGPFLENWFDAWQDYLKNDDEGILLLETATADDLKSSDGDDLDAVQHAMAGIYLRSSNDKKAVPLLEAIVERESATLTLEDIHRLECMASLGKAYLNLKEFTKAIDMFRALNDAFDVLPFQDERRLTTMYCSALAYLNVDQPTRAAQLLEEVVIIEARLLPEDHAWRLLSMRRLAQAYMELEKIRKLEDAVSLLQKVMQRGRETLHTDPQELAITEAMLADARDTLAKTLQLQSRDQILASASALMRWACREITSRAAIMF